MKVEDVVEWLERFTWDPVNDKSGAIRSVIAERDALRAEVRKLRNAAAIAYEDRDALRAAGRMSDLIVSLVGGRAIDGVAIQPATVSQLPELFRRLNAARGDYDVAISKLHENEPRSGQPAE